jgi:AraC-like DNA-binding protein
MLKITKNGASDTHQGCLSFKRFSVLKNYQFALKTDEIGVLVLFSGTIKYKDHRSSANEIQTLLPNSGLLINHIGIPEIIDCDTDLDGLLLRLNVRCLQKILSALKYNADLERFVNEPLNCLTLPDNREIAVLLSSFDLYSNKLTFFSSELLYESKILELFWLLNDHCKVNFDRFVYQYLIPDRAFLDALMNKHFRENLSLNELAVLAGYSVSTFKRKFVEVYQSSPKRWLLNKRLQEAKTLLEFSDKTVSEIGYEVGFENISHFIYSFKAKFGVTPKSLQEQFVRQRLIRIAS